MKHKLKLIAMTAVLAVAGAANAAPIDNGAGGNGGLMFSIWDGANSYSLNLGQTIDSFQALVAGATPLNLSFTPDALFTSFMSTANKAALQWNVVATDISGAIRTLDTYSALPVTPQINGTTKTMANGVTSFINSVNLSLATANSAVFALGTAGYAGGPLASTNTLLNFSPVGTVANNSYATGLGFLRVDGLAFGSANSTYTPFVQNGVAVAAWLDTSATATANTFNLAVAAVPEPETYAMLLAGLGLMGAIARRRNKKSA